MMSGSTKYSLPNSLWTWAHPIMIVTSWHERWLAPDWYHNTVGCHPTLCWHLIFIYYMVSRSRRWQRPQQRISCKVNPESSICSADDQAESPLADNRPASHHKLYQPLQLRHPPGPAPIPSCCIHCANAFLSIIECEFIHTGDATQGDVRAVNTPIQLNSMHNSINNTQTFW